MQDEVSRKIAQALEVELSPADERRMARAVRPSGEAYELYLRGRSYLLSETVEDTRAAIAAFEHSFELDPRFALALASRRAVAIEPGLPEGHYLEGLLAWSPRHGFDHATAIREYLAAIAGRPNPTDAHERLGVVLFHVAMLEESASHALQALAINPDDTPGKIYLGFARYLQGRYREGLEISIAAEREPSLWCSYQIALCRLRLGDLDGAASAAERGGRLFPGDPGSHSRVTAFSRAILSSNLFARKAASPRSSKGSGSSVTATAASIGSCNRPPAATREVSLGSGASLLLRDIVGKKKAGCLRSRPIESELSGSESLAPGPEDLERIAADQPVDEDVDRLLARAW